MSYINIDESGDLGTKLAVQSILSWLQSKLMILKS